MIARDLVRQRRKPLFADVMGHASGGTHAPWHMHHVNAADASWESLRPKSFLRLCHMSGGVVFRAALAPELLATLGCARVEKPCVCVRMRVVRQVKWLT